MDRKVLRLVSTIVSRVVVQYSSESVPDLSGETELVYQRSNVAVDNFRPMMSQLVPMTRARAVSKLLNAFDPIHVCRHKGLTQVLLTTL